ncbi:MAG: hypothetical protein JKY37_12630 [Nannocystaceae bacterium]|nr:hypothetical protein [Nannocystaceae bacterium]
MDPVAASLVAELRDAVGGSQDEWGDIVLAFLCQAQEAWPTIPSPSTKVMVTALKAAGVESPGNLAALDAAELWIVAACAEGEPVALARFEQKYVAPLAPALRAMNLDEAEADDIKQRVRVRLMTAEQGEPIRLLQYAGRGGLFGLVKVVAIRLALDDKRRHARAPDRGTADARTVERMLDGDLGPELAVIEGEHRSVVKEAFEGAVQSLGAKERALLRLHLLEGSSIDDIAALHAVHRSTAARWITTIRQSLADHTHAQLRSKLKLDDDRLESMLRAAESRIDLSFSRLLRPSQSEKGRNG